MKFFDKLKIRNLLVVYTFAVFIAMSLMIDGVFNSTLVNAQTVYGPCTGLCQSGETCNQFGRPNEGKMWSCRLVNGSYGCIQDDINSGGSKCYLKCPNTWAPCGCNVNSCVNECLDQHKNDKPGHYKLTRNCGGCHQDFTCGCDIVASPTNTPIITTPVITTPVVTTPVITTPVVTTPVITTPVVTTPVITTPVVTTPVVTTPVVTTPLIPGFQIVKTAVDGPGPYKVNDTVHFSIVMTNTGSMPITAINFIDRFDASKLFLTQVVYNTLDVTRFFTIDNNAGVISYDDITRLVNDFPAGRSVRIDFYFKALASTDYSCNDVIGTPNTGTPVESRSCISIVLIRPTTDI